MSGLLHDNGRRLLKFLEAKEFPQPEYIHIRYPVLFCHGFGSLANVIKPSPMNDICMLARSHGVAAFAPNIIPYHSIRVRAQDWNRLVGIIMKKTRKKKVNVIAHSMAGLDIRYLISRLEMGGRISSLTTISTPHHGTSLAEWALMAPIKVQELLIEIFNWMGNSLYPRMRSDVWTATQELTREYVETMFNPQNPDDQSVKYYSYSAACGKNTRTSISRFILPMNSYIYEKEGINDGFVAEESAHWGEFIETTRLSHIGQLRINLSSEEENEWRNFWIGVLQMLSKKGH